MPNSVSHRASVHAGDNAPRRPCPPWPASGVLRERRIVVVRAIILFVDVGVLPGDGSPLEHSRTAHGGNTIITMI
jgi:hypothetical protein